MIILTIIVTNSLMICANKLSHEETLPYSCSSPVYCYGNLLKTVQLSRIFSDSKTFVDLRMKNSENVTLKNFNDFMVTVNQKPKPQEVQRFVDDNFEEGNELIEDQLTDWKRDPAFLKNIKDKKLRDFGFELNQIWPSLAVRIKDEVFNASSLYSIDAVPNVFIKPGGRFKELYYFDSYWIVKGLLICGMPNTTRGMIENLIWLIDKYGYIPNGGRVYYAKRSQPPVLTAMVSKYIYYTKDLPWLSQNIKKLESELLFWLKSRRIEMGKHSLLRYYAPSEGPRPESYHEDYATANQSQIIYTELKSAAESGWDFSSRWFVPEKQELKFIRTTDIIPVDLNAIFCGAVSKLAHLYSLLGNQEKAKEWKQVYMKFRKAIYEVLWSDKEGIWFDIVIQTQEHRKMFYPSNITPLWSKCLGKDQNYKKVGDRVASYLKKSGVLGFLGGTPASLDDSGQQWDFPNAWPPLQDFIIQGLDNSKSDVAQKLAVNLAELWVNSNYRGFQETKKMYEKYDCRTPGKSGGGGEYNPQTGFGWTNGVILSLLNKYGQKLTAINV